MYLSVSDANLGKDALFVLLLSSMSLALAQPHPVGQ